MTATLPVTSYGAMIRAQDVALKDKRYARSPVGQAVARYLRYVQFALAKNTHESYEQVLAWLALDHDDFDSIERFADPDGERHLEAFLARHWMDAAPSTKRQRLAAVRAFFRWARMQGMVSRDPAANLQWRIRGGHTQRRAHDRHTVERLIGGQDSLRDQCALGLLARLGLRKNELRLLQLRDIDLVRGNVTVLHGKGGKTRVLPLEFTSLRDDLEWHLRERSADAHADGREPGFEYLLYPRGLARTKAMDLSTAHRWFKRCLQNAGLPESLLMHELRHTAGDDTWRRTGNIVTAQLLLGHESVGTTQAYLHPTEEDLRAGLRIVEASWKGEDA